MNAQGWTFLIVGLTFALYVGIAIRARATSTASSMWRAREFLP